MVSLVGVVTAVVSVTVGARVSILNAAEGVLAPSGLPATSVAPPTEEAVTPATVSEAASVNVSVQTVFQALRAPSPLDANEPAVKVIVGEDRGFIASPYVTVTV